MSEVLCYREVSHLWYGAVCAFLIALISTCTVMLFIYYDCIITQMISHVYLSFLLALDY